MVKNPFSKGRDAAVNVTVGAQTDGFQDAIAGAEDALLSFKGVVGAAGMLLAGLSVGALASATDEAIRFEDAMTDVERVVGGTSIDTLRESISELNTELPQSNEELAKLMEIGGRAGVSGEDRLESFASTTAKLGEATDLTSEQAAEQFTKLSNALDTPITKLENMGSAVNTLGQETAASTASISQGMAKAAPAAGSLGVKFEDLNGMVATLVSSGMNAERAGTRLNRTFTLLSQKSDEVADAVGMDAEKFQQLLDANPTKALRRYLETLGGIESKSERVAAAEEIFGSGAGKVVASLSTNVDDLNKNIETSSESFSEAGSLQKEFETSMESTASQLDIARSRLENLGVATGDVLLKAFNPLVDRVNDALSVLNNLGKETQGIIGAASGLIGAIGGTVVGIEAFAAATGASVSATSALGSALAVLTGPVGLVAAAAVALGAAWTTNFLGIRDVTMDVFEEVRSVVEGAITFLEEELITPYVETVGEVWSKHGEEIRDEIGETMDHIEDVIDDTLGAIESGIIEPFVSAATAFWEEFGDEITGAVETAFDTITDIAAFQLDALLQTVDIVLDLMQGDFDEAWAGITSLVSDAVSAITSTVKSGVNSIATFVSTIGRDDIKAAYQAVGSAIRDVFLGLFDVGGTLLSIVGDFFGNLFTYVASGQYFKDTINAYGTLIDGILGVWDGLLKVGGDIWSSLTGFASDLSEYVSSGAVFTDVTGAFDTLVGGIKAAFEGLWTGLTGSEGTVPSMIGDIADYVTETGSQILSDAFGGAIDDVEDAISWLTGSGEDSFQGDVMSTFTTVGEDIRNAFPYLTGSGDDTLTGDIKEGVEYLTESGRGTLVADVKNGLSYLLTTGDDSLASDFATALEGVGSQVGQSMKKSINDALGLPFEHTVGRVEIKGEEIFGGQTISIPALESGGLVEQSGVAFVDEGEMFSGVPGAEVDRSPGMMLSKDELRDAVAEGVARAADGDDLFGAGAIVRALKKHAGSETTIEFRDQDRYRAARR